MKADQVFVHIPYALLQGHLDFILNRRINPEIALSGDVLDTIDQHELADIARILRQNGLRCTIHAPFMDLSPGALDSLVRKATRERFRQTMNIAATLQPTVIVFHPGYDRWRFGSSRDRWLQHSVVTFQEVLEQATPLGCLIAVENIFEEDPATLRTLLEAVDSPLFRHCFDVGHWNLFSKHSMEAWFAELGDYIAEAHIHDNHGAADDHAPLGEAGIDFTCFFQLMARYAPDAAWTIEAHNRQAIERALHNLEPYRNSHRK